MLTSGLFVVTFVPLILIKIMEFDCISFTDDLKRLHGNKATLVINKC